MPRAAPVLYVAQIGTGVLRSTDQGATWTLIRRDLGLHPALVLRPDPHDPERIFAGTTNGGIFTYTLPPEEASNAPEEASFVKKDISFSLKEVSFSPKDASFLK